MEVTYQLILDAQRETGITPTAGVIYSPRDEYRNPCGCALGMLAIYLGDADPSKELPNGFHCRVLDEYFTTGQQLGIASGFDSGFISGVLVAKNDKESCQARAKTHVDSQSDDDFRQAYIESYIAGAILGGVE